MAEQTETMTEQNEHTEQGDSFADAMAAMALIAIFVVTCIYWISGQ